MLLRSNSSALKTPDGKVLLKDINFEILRGELIHVTGDNGIGKSSLFKAILGYEGLLLYPLVKKKFSYFYLPQMENKEFLLPLNLRDISASSPELKWNQASGGERKKNMLNRALSNNADLYILDEPYNHLDEETISSINKKIANLIQQNKTVIMISHKVPIIADYKILTMDVNQWRY